MFKKTVKDEIKNQIKLLSVQKGRNYETECTQYLNELLFKFIELIE
jgi:hypothetical protein